MASRTAISSIAAVPGTPALDGIDQSGDLPLALLTAPHGAFAAFRRGRIRKAVPLFGISCRASYLSLESLNELLSALILVVRDLHN